MDIDFTKKEAKIVKASKSLVDFLLTKNTKNRNEKKSHTAWIREAIEDKNFILTGQAISFSKEGVLIDGQHRLMAIRDAGYPPVELLIMTGLDEKAKVYVDQHAKRSTGDMLKICVDKEITNRMAGIVSMFLQIADGQNGFVIRTIKPALEDVLSTMNQYKYWIQLLVSASDMRFRAGTLCALLHYAIRHDIDSAIDLAERTKKGENLTKNDPAFKLRNHIYGLSGNGSVLYGRAGQILDYKNTVTCCIAHARGDKIEQLKPSKSWNKLPKKTKVYLKGSYD